MNVLIFLNTIFCSSLFFENSIINEYDSLRGRAIQLENLIVLIRDEIREEMPQMLEYLTESRNEKILMAFIKYNESLCLCNVGFLLDQKFNDFIKENPTKDSFYKIKVALERLSDFFFAFKSSHNYFMKIVCYDYKENENKHFDNRLRTINGIYQYFREELEEALKKIEEMKIEINIKIE
ncbi:putative SP-containing protein [Vairimorpha necatrix]|uniref:SP-containing protein n=1 Tax=Vairimorpha necatrix TaxID=6039 RepID=A0AAX4JDL7_9MICR